MARWSAGRIALLCVGYVVIYLAVSVQWLRAYARTVARPQGLGADYLVGVGIRPWWLALLILPPVALFAWWLVARWRS
ncbi:MAG: hypothetical protein IRY91_01525 [Gemmatimonadaceae bacterium]|nr:hypothetical protein [Gemmatimonadaceae bacterium]